MRKYVAHIIMIVSMVFSHEMTCGQQDPLLTQYMFNIQSVNPAYTGIWNRSGVNALIRKQWAGIDRTPLTQMVTFFTPMKKESVGIGFTITDDHFGLERRLGIFGDYAYEIDLSETLKLRMGLKFGFMNYQNPLTKYKLYPDGKYDLAFAEDIDLKFLPNFGVGAFLPVFVTFFYRIYIYLK